MTKNKFFLASVISIFFILFFTFKLLSHDNNEYEYIRQYIINTYLKDDMRILEEDQGYYKYQSFDLNSDNENEYIIYFLGVYFCGTSGCNTIIFDNQEKLIGRFSLTELPIWASDQITNNYRDLIIESKNYQTQSDYKIYKFNAELGEYIISDESIALDEAENLSKNWKLLIPDVPAEDIFKDAIKIK